MFKEPFILSGYRVPKACLQTSIMVRVVTSSVAAWLMTFSAPHPACSGSVVRRVALAFDCFVPHF